MSEGIAFVVNISELNRSIRSFQDHGIIQERMLRGKTLYYADYPVEVCKSILKSKEKV